MAQTAVFQTYGDSTIKTDIVLDSVEILSAKEDGIFSILGKTKALNMVHSYPVDTLLAAGTQAVEQGADFTSSTRTAPTLLSNIVEEIAVKFAVTRPQQAVAHYTGTDELARQTAKALVEWSNAAEYDLVRSTLASGISGTVAKMSGILQAISKSTNTTSQTSGTVFSASILDSLMVNCWTNSNGDVATDLYIGGIGKKNIDNFTAKTNVVVNSPDIRGIVKTVTTYETSMGTLTIHKHRYIQVAGDATLRFVAIRPDKLKVAFLDAPYMITDLQKNGAYTPRAVYGSMTLETRNQDSNFYGDGYLLA